MHRKPFPAIPQPQPGENNILALLHAIKENVEMLTDHRGTKATTAITWQDLVDLGLITPDQVPRE